MTEDKKEVKEKKEKKCGTCKHSSHRMKAVGIECRCHPPQVVLVKDQKASVWPEVKVEDWCGQWVEGKGHLKPVIKRAGMV